MVLQTTTRRNPRAAWHERNAVWAIQQRSSNNSHVRNTWIAANSYIKACMAPIFRNLSVSR